MNPENTTIIAEKLEELIAAAGSKVEQAWPYLMKQAYVEGWCWIGVTVFVLCIAAIMLVLAIKETGDMEEFTGPAGVAALIIGGFMGLGAILAGIPHLLNPEYYAIQDLLNIVK